LSSFEDPARRATLIAAPGGIDSWHIDIRLQRGPQTQTETVFLDL